MFPYRATWSDLTWTTVDVFRSRNSSMTSVTIAFRITRTTGPTSFLFQTEVSSKYLNKQALAIEKRMVVWRQKCCSIVRRMICSNAEIAPKALPWQTSHKRRTLMWVDLIPNPIREIISPILMHAEERLGRTVSGTAHPFVDTSPVCLLPKPIVILSESL